VNEVNPGSVIGRAWAIYKSQFGTLIIAAVLLSLITLWPRSSSARSSASSA